MKRYFFGLGGFSWPLIVGASAFLFAIGNGRNLLIDGDTYWHLAAGRWILEHGAVPHADPFSHTLPGAPWTAHEWLSEVLLHLAFQAGGWPGVVVLTAAAFAATLAYLSRFLHAYLAPAHVLIFSILALGMVAPHLLARPHLLAMPLLVIWTANLVRACEAGWTPPLWLLGVMAVWANLHGGFTLGIALAGAFGIEAVLLAGGRQEKLAAARRWGLFLALAVLAGMLTPHGIKGYFFTAEVMGMSYALSNIGEWLPPNFQEFQFLEVWLMLLLAALFTRGLRLSAMRLLVLLSLLHLALSHARNVELIGLLAPLLLASAIRAQWTRFQGEGKHTGNLDRFFLRHAQPAALPAVVLIFAVAGALGYYKIRQQGIAPPAKKHPIAAIQAVKEQGIRGPVFNAYPFGGYLIFSGIPAFIDGRADMYGDDFMKRYLEAIRLPRSNGLEKLLDEYGVTWTLLPPKSPAVDHLDTLAGWRRMYADGTAVVHVRGITEPQR